MITSGVIFVITHKPAVLTSMAGNAIVRFQDSYTDSEGSTFVIGLGLQSVVPELSRHVR
jgi:putative Mn2+ efflux pump MntP